MSSTRIIIHVRSDAQLSKILKFINNINAGIFDVEFQNVAQTSTRHSINPPKFLRAQARDGPTKNRGKGKSRKAWQKH